MKRKLKSSIEVDLTRKKKKQEAPKTPRCDSPREVEEFESLDQGELGDSVEERSWRNLELILSLQSRELGVEKKVDLGFGFVKALVGEREVEDDKDEECEAVNTSRLIVFLSDWIQSLLISMEKKSKVEDDIDFDPRLDLRCWEIFRFCLKQSSTLHVSLNLSRNLLKVIGYVAKNLSTVLKMPLPLGESCLIGQGFEVYSSVLGCVGLLFSSEGSISNESLDLWLSTVDAILELVPRVLAENIEDYQARKFVLKFSCLLLEPFSKFLRSHPTKKNGFRDFVDRLLEPLLYVLGLLHLHVDKNKSTPGWERTLLKLIEEILSNGLFHSAHIDGFLGIRGTERYVLSKDESSKENSAIPKSYHRFLFVKLEGILSRKKELELSCLGDLLSLFVNQVIKQQGASNLLGEGKLLPKGDSNSKQVEENPSNRMLIDTFCNGNERSEKSHCSVTLSAVKRKSFFDFFLVLMEPIVLEMRGCVKSGSECADICCVVKSANSLLFSLVQERVYVKTDDISEGACLYFLKTVFKEIVLLASQLQKCYVDDGRPKNLISSAKELITATGYLLEIDYEVVENDLVSLWLMILSYMEISLSAGDTTDECSVTSLTLGLGCQVINLYSELRQINSAVFALCKAVRLMIPRADGVGERNCARFFPPPLPSISRKRIVKSVEMLFSSQDLRLAIHSAIKLIPEGQASGCIRHLTTDISETMDWIKFSYSMTARKELVLLAELLAGALLEIYMLMLDTLTITTGNSNLVGLSIDSLMNLICPYLSCLVSPHTDSVRKFLSAVIGKTLDALTTEKKSKIYIKSIRLFIVFFFRVYMSSRSLYRQAISLVPPKKSKEMANAMGDFSAACCGNDQIKKKSWSDEGYFSWICQPSASILDLTKRISDIYLKDDSVDCCLLIYLLHRMALQRLSDLNKHIKSLDYLSQLSDNQIHGKLLDQTGQSRGRKRNKRLRKHLSVLKQEGEDLTNLLLGYISSVFDDQETSQAIDVHCQWDLSISAINKKSLPTALLWVLSQHIDIWCSHAGKKKLKTFLSWMICTSTRTLSSVGIPTVNGACDMGEGTQKKKIGVQQISSELLNDSVLYEHEFVCRNFAPAFCHILERTAVELLKEYAGEKVNFNSPLEWSDVFLSLESSMVGLSDKSQSEICLETDTSHLDSVKFTACQNLLDLLCQMPKEYLKAKSFQLYSSHVLDLERLIVLSMLRCHHKFSPGDQQKLLSLFNTCRRTLKNIFMASCEKLVRSTKLPLSDCSLLALWLFKSAQVSITFQGTVRKNCASKAREYIFFLVDHTSYISLTISKYQFSREMLMDPAKLSEEQSFLPELVEEQNSMNGSDFHLDTSIRAENISQIFLICGRLVEEIKSLLIPFRDTLSNESTKFECKTLTLSKLSSTLSCLGGVLWGVASAASQRDVQKNHQKSKLKLKSEVVSIFCSCIYVLWDFVEVFRQSMFADKDMELGYPTDTNGTGSLDDNEDSNDHMDVELDLVETREVKKHFLERLIKGDCAEMTLVLRQLLIDFAALLRLNLHVHGVKLSPRFVSVLTGISCVMLSGLADMNEALEEFPFVWLDGALKFLEELGSQFRSSNPTLNRDLYSRLIELHLKIIGKCISVQGKGATLASHQTALGTEAFHAKKATSENMFNPEHWLDEFKDRLRMSFKAFIQNSSELHLLSAVQAIERALIGVWEFCPAIYKMQTGNRDGGNIPLTAVAGIDCLDLILEHASGPKRQNVVKRHIQSLIAALFSIMAHLRSSFIFFTKSVSNQGLNYPDPGAVILMCVEVLTRVSGKHAVFQMEAWHISQSMRMPGALFQDFLQLTDSRLPVSDYKDPQRDPIASSNSHQMDREFSISLYAACCRLLYTIVKHHKSKTKGCIATLQESVAVLLRCLEGAGNGSSYFSSWNVEEGTRCASFLRRIYEELRQQRDVLGEHCFKFLSAYIWVSSGYGSLKTGFKREVDEALRPGVYALIDSCSPNDLQYLHTVFGEGPCRNSLATLQHDYKLNFKYEGKV